jgi:hypothetical protein
MNFVIPSIVISLIAPGGEMAGAVTVFSDDFESYADTGSLKAAGAWGDLGSSGSTATLTANGHPGQAMHSTGGTDAIHQFPVTPVVTDAEPLVLEYDYFDATTGSGDRLTLGLRNSAGTGVGAFFELGEYNAADPDPVATDDTLVQGYAVRAVFAGAPGNGTINNQNWYIITTTKVLDAWHHFTLTVGETFLTASVDLSADGSVDASVTMTLTAHAGKTYDSLRWGGPSNLSSTGVGVADNVALAIVPEPATGWVAGLTGIGLLAVRRRGR